jgi:hypothetical protein
MSHNREHPLIVRVTLSVTADPAVGRTAPDLSAGGDVHLCTVDGQNQRGLKGDRR